MLQPQPSLARFGSGQAETIHNPVSSIQYPEYAIHQPAATTTDSLHACECVRHVNL